jgi:hypothetical protein
MPIAKTACCRHGGLFAITDWEISARSARTVARSCIDGPPPAAIARLKIILDVEPAVIRRIEAPFDMRLALG